MFSIDWTSIDGTCIDQHLWDLYWSALMGSLLIHIDGICIDRHWWDLYWSALMGSVLICIDGICIHWHWSVTASVYALMNKNVQCSMIVWEKTRKYTDRHQTDRQTGPILWPYFLLQNFTDICSVCVHTDPLSEGPLTHRNSYNHTFYIHKRYLAHWGSEQNHSITD